MYGDLSHRVRSYITINIPGYLWTIFRATGHVILSERDWEPIFHISSWEHGCLIPTIKNSFACSVIVLGLYQMSLLS